MGLFQRFTGRCGSEVEDQPQIPTSIRALTSELAAMALRGLT